MSYFATIKCPKCGHKEQLLLGGWMWYGYDTYKCKNCGNDFDPQKNCLNFLQDIREKKFVQIVGKLLLVI